ncbi:MAG: DUF1553 domain-containing protein [Acidobacteriota bacterium]
MKSNSRNRHRIVGFFVALLLTGLTAGKEVVVSATGQDSQATGEVDFVESIEPIFSARCVQCHGPKNPMGDLRLDSSKALEGGLSGKVILPGRSSDSLLMKMISGEVEGKRMPLGGDPLEPREIDLIRAWIDQGARWPEGAADGHRSEDTHWAYLPPVRPVLPPVQKRGWVQNPIDAFVLARLEKEGLSPAPEADRAQLIRRLSLDLIGLPPSLEEVEAFLADNDPEASSRLVNRLLTSPHYGEKWARPWLDLARYADSHGYESDPLRVMWKFRDWVIDALNRNVSFDEFTIEQLAGDMLPHATLEQKIASGFHRNTMINMEGGVDAEETRVESVADRTNTTATIWLGTTLACAQCHNHKYDPFTQKEYYQFFAFFNNTVDGAQRDEKPEIEAPSAVQRTGQELIQSEISRLEKVLSTSTPELEQAQAVWEAQAEKDPVVWTTVRPTGLLSAGGATLEVLEDGSVRARGANPESDVYTVVLQTDLKNITGIRLEALADHTLPQNGPGRAGDGSFLLSRFEVQASPRNSPHTVQPVSFRLLAVEPAEVKFTGEDYLNGKADLGWKVSGGKNATLVLEVDAKVGFEQGTALTLALGNRSKQKDANLGRFRLQVTESPSPVSLPDSMRAILTLSVRDRSEAQRAELASFYRSVSPKLDEVRRRIGELRQTLPEVPKVMVMQERTQPRDTHIHIRGSFLNKGEPVSPAVPGIFPALPADQPANRLTLARWLVSEKNPLVARVTVNRIWEQYFGRGLVATPEDFGTQGEKPSHPELLDWLAVEFMENGWDLKALHRLIVTSATYRQASRVTPELYERDPYNELLARGPRFRLAAESIRDVALAIGGLLSHRIGGASTFPPQPEGIWTQHYSQEKWTASTGPDRYRRGLYTFWRRTSPYPSLANFDAPSREYCTVRRPRTNTPLQALTTLNDPAFFEAAQALALRMVRESGPTVEGRSAYGFRLCAARSPKPSEVEEVVALWKRQARRFSEGANAREALELVGDQHWPTGTPVWEAAAWTVVANVLLNLDETITKE